MKRIGQVEKRGAERVPCGGDSTSVPSSLALKRRFLILLVVAFSLGLSTPCWAIGNSSLRGEAISTVVISQLSSEASEVFGSLQTGSENEPGESGDADDSTALEETPAQAHDRVQKKRLAVAGGICVFVVGTIIILFGYFRLNHLTRGFYAGRLQFFVLVLFTGLLAIALWIIRDFGM